MEYWIDPPAEKIEIIYCPQCGQEADLNRNFKIECTLCDKIFAIPEPDFYEWEEKWLPS